MEEQTTDLVALLEGYFIKKAHHINVNVLRRELVKELSSIRENKKIDFVEFGRFPAKKLEGGYRIIKEMAQELRNDAKKNIVSLRDNYFSKPVSLLIEELGEYRNRSGKRRSNLSALFE